MLIFYTSCRLERKKLLKELGLGSYEAAVYLKLLELGAAEASVIYREARVPFGRIYEELNSLAGKGLVEIQTTRPKKYLAKNPKAALSSLLKMRLDEMEARFQDTVETASQVEAALLKRIPTKPAQDVFWTVAMGRHEISGMTRHNLNGTEKEVCAIVKGNAAYWKTYLLPDRAETVRCLEGTVKRGNRVRVLVGGDFGIPRDIVNTETVKFLRSKVELRSLDSISSYFGICDGSTVTMTIDNPANTDEILAAIRIHDVKLARKLKAKFEELWKRAKPVKLV